MLVKIKDIQREDNCLVFYTSKSYRWEEGQSADPLIEDLEYHLTEEEAIAAAESLTHSIGYHPQAEKLFSRIDDLDEDTEEVDLRNLDVWNAEFVFDGDTNSGESIEGAIIVEWSWERHPGYCRNLLAIGVGGDWQFSRLQYECDLITGNEESTFRSNYSVLLSKKEVDECEDREDLETAIEEALNQGYWRWNYFKKNPNSGSIRERIDEIVIELK
jgi:hypothetical protein